MDVLKTAQCASRIFSAIPAPTPVFLQLFQLRNLKHFFPFSPSIPCSELPPPALFSPAFCNPTTAYLPGSPPPPSSASTSHLSPLAWPNLLRVITTRGITIVFFGFLLNGSPLTSITRCSNLLVKSGISFWIFFSIIIHQPRSERKRPD